MDSLAVPKSTLIPPATVNYQQGGEITTITPSTLSLTNTALVLTNADFTTFNGPSAIIRQSELSARIKNLEKTFYPIDVSIAMINLKQVGTLMQVAYGGTKGFKSHREVGNMLNRFHTFLYDCFLAMKELETNSLEVLKEHQFAVLAINENKIEEALVAIANCSTLAKEMAEASEKLAKQTEELSAQARKAMDLAIDDETLSEERKNEVKKQIAEHEARQAHSSKLKEEFHAMIETEKRREEELMEKEEKAREKAEIAAIFKVALTPVTAIGSAVVTPIGAVLEKGIKTFAGPFASTLKPLAESVKKMGENNTEELDKVKLELVKKEELLKQAKEEKNEEKIKTLEIEIKVLNADIKIKEERAYQAKTEMKNGIEELRDSFKKNVESYQNERKESIRIRREFEEKHAKINADLADSMTRLKNFNEETNDLGASLESLSIALKTLGFVKTVFEDARAYFRQVESHCNKLANSRNITRYKELGTDNFTKAIVDSALNWVVLWKQLDGGRLSVQDSCAHTRAIMQDLPTREEAKALIRSIAIPRLQSAITSEDNI